MKRLDTKVPAPELRRDFRRRLLRWYGAHRRELPWRKTSDPYRVWLSEIMLQQTRVNAVLDHYRRFLERFPSVVALAAAPESAVLAAWSGLGYYRRARMLHAAARKIVEELGGQFPRTAAEWRDLPGIGRYTAAAIASIAYNEPVAVLDGNVERVLDRFLGHALSTQQAWDEAGDLLSRRRPGDFNQAMMELGAMVCTPRTPLCLTCPVHEMCATRGERPAEKKSGRQTKKEVCYSLETRRGRVFLVQRAARASLMPGMWELPEVPGGPNGTKPLLTVRHSITTTDYVVRVVSQRAEGAATGQWVPAARLSELPLTGLARKILRATHVL